MSDPKRDLSFRSPEEFNDICHQLAMSMHHKNRVALGESGFAAELAEVIRRVGLLFRDRRSDPQIVRDFGTAYTPAGMSKGEQSKALIAMLFPAPDGKKR